MEIKEAHRHNIKCPVPGCEGLFDHADVEHAIAGDDRASQRLQELLIISSALNPGHCPYTDCSAFLDLPTDTAGGGVECLECHRLFCAPCKVPFHAGLSCAEFQALPPGERSAEDRALLQLAEEAGWKRCPQCGAVVDRLPGGCNFMVCRAPCRTAFCYNCGVRYIHTRATANNAHGQPGCRCGLFGAPPPAADDAEAPRLRLRGRVNNNDEEELRNRRRNEHRRAMDLDEVLVNQKVEIRGGIRHVKGAHKVRHPENSNEWVPVGRGMRCHFADSHDDCPRGVRCWFRHVMELEG